MEAIDLNVHTIPPARPVSDLEADVRAGLFERPRTLPPKYFYDERGSDLFDQICDEPEYYPTRAEAELLRRSADAIVERVRPAEILELGSGTARKTRILFDACERAGIAPRYTPFDVCDEMVARSGSELLRDYPWLTLRPVAGDYTAGLAHLPDSTSPTLCAFLGGTVGNFEHADGVAMLRDVRAQLTGDDFLLVGADRVKPPAALHAAYNDAAGLTAAFNRNVLSVLNRELEAGFDVDAFEHYACFNPRESRIEMYLVAMRDQSVGFNALDASIDIREGEAILTEISRKFTRATLEGLLAEAGFAVVEHFELQDTKFSLVLARPV